MKKGKLESGVVFESRWMPVEGKMTLVSWTSKDGQVHTTTEGMWEAYDEVREGK